MAQDLLLKDALLARSPFLQRLIEQVRREPSLLIEELWEGPKALVLSLLAATLNKHLLIISGGSADRLYTDLASFGVENLFDFPAWETLPGEEIAPSPDLVGKRLEVLHSLLQTPKPHVLLAPLQSVLHKLAPPHSLSPLLHEWKVGEKHSFSTLFDALTRLGYQKAPVVSDKGEFALRGGILDLFPLSSTDPYRVEFFGDQIEEIRTFDPISQKSIQKVSSFLLPPAQEIGGTASLFDYLGEKTLVVFNDLLQIEDHWVSIHNLPGASSPLFSSLNTLLERALTLPHLYLLGESLERLSPISKADKLGRAFYSGSAPLQSLTFEFAHAQLTTKRLIHPFIPLSDAFSLSEHESAASREEILQGLARYAKSSLELHCAYSSEAEKNAFLAALTHPLPKHTYHHIASLSSGFFLDEEQLSLLPMAELTRRLPPRRQKWRSTIHTPSADFHELVPGTLVVHYHSGIAKYIGVEKRPNHAGILTEFMVLEYANNSTLHVPASQSHLVSRYIGTKEEIPVLSRLGSNRWIKTRTLAQTSIIGYADDLLRLQAKRAVEGGYRFPADSETMRLFEADFPFVETQDQSLAIESIKQEMQSAKAMDLLICGDVGYGKTEVAMRAAFKAAADGRKQVAVLVPTTVLALQHHETFCARMANFSVRVGVLSRFHTAKENQTTLEAVQKGEIDILIGTHRLLSQDVLFSDLGLLIIDEEQRFGVRAKEKLKNRKVGVDCLTLSATPIPRTLYLSLVGAKPIATINTPPQDRLPIKSIIAERDTAIIKNALLRELSRDGQAYFIHNRVESIGRVTDEIQQLLPQARIVTGHGQMSGDELDAVFHKFKQGAADILVATTIIENGIDIPNANTILIDRSDTFGLADLYQMRGRVGRWNRPAFAYFLVPAKRELSELTRKRLHALAEASGFGAGMKIAMRDLEIRGSGDILGTQQSGQVSSIGFHLYCKLLKKAIEALKKGSSPSFTETKMEFSFDASLSEDYINESSLRMEIYHRLGEAVSPEEVDTILAELKDRFGPHPTPLLWLYHMTRLRLVASSLHITLLKFEKLTLTIEKQTKTTPLKKVVPLPRTQDPALFESQVIELIKQV
jgi:transcription-repair coupling factor (superfamily II helicase)